MQNQFNHQPQTMGANWICGLLLNYNKIQEFTNKFMNHFFSRADRNNLILANPFSNIGLVVTVFILKLTAYKSKKRCKAHYIQIVHQGRKKIFKIPGSKYSRVKPVYVLYINTNSKSDLLGALITLLSCHSKIPFRLLIMNLYTKTQLNSCRGGWAPSIIHFY